MQNFYLKKTSKWFLLDNKSLGARLKVSSVLNTFPYTLWSRPLHALNWKCASAYSAIQYCNFKQKKIQANFHPHFLGSNFDFFGRYTHRDFPYFLPVSLIKCLPSLLFIPHFLKLILSFFAFQFVDRKRPYMNYNRNIINISSPKISLSFL